MNYYDGNTVTAFWNYAQRYAMSDNSFGTTFGPSSPGAINLVSGRHRRSGYGPYRQATRPLRPPPRRTPTSPRTAPAASRLTNDAQPYWDDCSTRDAVALSGDNIGDELNAAGLSWGWFQGGFRPTTTFTDATAAVGHAGQPTATFIPDEFEAAGSNASVPHSSNQGLCNAVHPVGAGSGGTALTPGTGQYGNKDDYIPHHEPFQYYASTANPHHLTCRSTVADLAAAIGTDTQTSSTAYPQFDTAEPPVRHERLRPVGGGDRARLPSPTALPAVSFLKAPATRTGTPPTPTRSTSSSSSSTSQRAQHTPDWTSTAVVIAYDDSDGWYDHAYSGVHNPRQLSRRRPHGPRSVRSREPRWPASRAAAATALGCRCWSSRRGRSTTTRPHAHRPVVHPSFVEDNWGLPRISGRPDATAGALDGMFDFGQSHGQAGGNPPTDEPFVLDL